MDSKRTVNQDKPETKPGKRQRPNTSGSEASSSTTEMDKAPRRPSGRAVRSPSISPVDYIVSSFRQNGFSGKITMSGDSHLFQPPTEEQIAAYTQDVLRAVRNKSMEELRLMHEEGRCLQCCNRFGEGLMHMACRRGYLEVVRFLVMDAKVSLFVRDDYGRTPMHDACWSTSPNYELIEFLIRMAPDLLLMSDVRGHTPFAYVRKEHWKPWVMFLQNNKVLLRSRLEISQIVPVRTVG